MLAIRSYTPHDAGVTIEIFLCAIRETASRDYNPAQINAWAQVDNHEAWAKRRASRPTWIAVVDNESAGFSDLDSEGHLDMMFVHPRYQGAGVASTLLRTVEVAAHNLNLPCITTEASLTAQPFFERRGFEIITVQEVQKRGQILKNFYMEKWLA